MRPAGVRLPKDTAKELIIVNIAGPMNPSKLFEIMKALNLPDTPGAGVWSMS